MKLRTIKKNTINSALNNASYMLNVIIQLKHAPELIDLIEQVNDYGNDDYQYNKQYNMFTDGIWFPLIDSQRKLIDTFSYDASKPITESPIEINVFAVEEPVRSNTLIKLFKPILERLKNMDVIDHVKVQIVQYNINNCNETVLFELE